MIESHIVGVHDVDQIHMMSPRPGEDQARRRHRTALESYVCGIHPCAARDDRHLAGIVREGDPAGGGSRTTQGLVVAGGIGHGVGAAAEADGLARLGIVKSMLHRPPRRGERARVRVQARGRHVKLA